MPSPWPRRCEAGWRTSGDRCRGTGSRPAHVPAEDGIPDRHRPVGQTTSVPRLPPEDSHERASRGSATHDDGCTMRTCVTPAVGAPAPRSPPGGHRTDRRSQAPGRGSCRARRSTEFPVPPRRDASGWPRVRLAGELERAGRRSRADPRPGAPSVRQVHSGGAPPEGAIRKLYPQLILDDFSYVLPRPANSPRDIARADRQRPSAPGAGSSAARALDHRFVHELNVIQAGLPSRQRRGSRLTEPGWEVDGSRPSLMPARAGLLRSDVRMALELSNRTPSSG